jgi:hypothetical protein
MPCEYQVCDPDPVNLQPDNGARFMNIPASQYLANTPRDVIITPYQEPLCPHVETGSHEPLEAQPPSVFRTSNQ